MTKEKNKQTGLSACPFCGGKPRRQSAWYSGKRVGLEYGSNGLVIGAEYESLKWYAVKCTECGVSQPKRKYHTREEADEAWNKRA